MIFKKKITVLFFCMIPMIAIHSQVTAIVCIQNESEAEDAPEIASYFEGSILENLFDSGFIVTNIPPVTGGKEVYENLSKIKESFEEFPDYLIVLYFSYGNEKIYDEVKKKIYPQWESLSYKIIKINSEKILYKKEFLVKKIKGDKYFEKANTIISDICEKTIKEIRRNK